MKKFKNSRRSVLRRRMGERLDLYIHTRGIDVGERPSGSAAQPRGSERPRAQARTVAGAPKAHGDSETGASSPPPGSPSPPPESPLPSPESPSMPPESPSTPPESPYLPLESPPLSPGGQSLPPESPPPSSRSPSPDHLGGNTGPSSTLASSGAALGTSGGGTDQDGIQPDPILEHPEDLDDGDDPIIHMPTLQTTQSFVDLLRVARLADSGMYREDIENMRDPEQEIELVDPSPLLRSIRHFTNNTSASREHYDTIREIELLNDPATEFLSFDQVKRRIRWLSGIVPLEHDMCARSCVAYTGPHAELASCPRCSSPRYIPGTTKAHKRFSTIPIGPIIQALYGSRETAEHMHYLEKKLAENLRIAQTSGGTFDVYDDTACGQELLDAWEDGHFTKTDVALQFSIDGATLRRDKPSDAWVFIWVIHNLPPEMRYTKAFVIPGAIVPGPNKPGDMDSFMFPSIYHVAALQREGLRVHDAYLNAVIPCSRPMILFGTADSPGSALMSGLVGHGGRYGCRLYCDMPGRRHDGDSHYYPVMRAPLNYDVEGCCHPDVTCDDLDEYRDDLPHKHTENIKFLLAAPTQAEFRLRRLAVGICKQTIFSGLPCQPIPVPSVFTMDIMHLTVLNEPDLFLKLFTGKLDVYDPDDRDTWDWALFYKNTALWAAHGETVTRAVPYIPSSFGRAPRDPAKKINSGYKAWEYQQYFYGLGPTLFRHILPRKYWLNFCKLVSGVRYLQRYKIAHEDLVEGHGHIMRFVNEFEELYYQRMESRIHFVRHSIHMLTHMAPETFHAGPLACYAQWTLETAIGNLGREIRQDRDIFANLTQRAILRAQLNSLQARFPGIRLDLQEQREPSLPNGALEFEGCTGYALLPRCEECPVPLLDDEAIALEDYWLAQGWPTWDSWSKAICRWSRARLPNGQTARSVWQESRITTSVRRVLCVEVCNRSMLHIRTKLI
jgi:hypothetical protein